MRQRRDLWRGTYSTRHLGYLSQSQMLVALSLTLLLLCIWSTLLFQRPVALAHAFVIGSDPVDGSTVSTAPRVVRIFFDADISPASIAHIFTPDEHIADAARSTIARTNPRELDTPLMPSSQLPQGSYTVRWTALASVDGHTTQGVIGFNIGQSSTGLPGQTILGPTTSNKLPELNLPGMLSVAWEWLVLMALTFWIGILIMEGLILDGLERTATLLSYARKQTRPLQWLCLTTLFVGEIITLILRTTQLTQGFNGSGINLALLGQILTETLYGYLWLIRLALILSALGFLWWTTRWQDNPGRKRQPGRSRSRFGRLRRQVTQKQHPASVATQSITPDVGAQFIAPQTEETSPTPVPTPSPSSSILWLLLAGLILLTIALSGDAASLAQPHISAIVLDWLYLAARCIWLGGLAYLGYVLIPLLPTAEPDHHVEVLTILLRRLHPLLLGAIGVLLVSGLYLTEGSLSNSQQLLTDPYGRTVLVACILVAVMILLSVYALFILRPKLARQAVLLPVVDAELPARRARQSALDQTARHLKRVLSLQSWLGAGVLLCAAVMAFFAPPIVFPAINYTQTSKPATSSTPQATSIMQTKQVGNLSITLQVLPAKVNYANTVIVTITDSSNGKFVTDAQIKMIINMEIMDMGTARATVKGGNPTYIATFDKDQAFSMFGAWDIVLVITRPHQPAIQTVFSVTLGFS